MKRRSCLRFSNFSLSLAGILTSIWAPGDTVLHETVCFALEAVLELFNDLIRFFVFNLKKGLALASPLVWFVVKTGGPAEPALRVNLRNTLMRISLLRGTCCKASCCWPRTVRPASDNTPAVPERWCSFRPHPPGALRNLPQLHPSWRSLRCRTWSCC
jgi:hypothetical protein